MRKARATSRSTAAKSRRRLRPAIIATVPARSRPVSFPSYLLSVAPRLRRSSYGRLHPPSPLLHPDSASPTRPIQDGTRIDRTNNGTPRRAYKVWHAQCVAGQCRSSTQSDRDDSDRAAVVGSQLPEFLSHHGAEGATAAGTGDSRNAVVLCAATWRRTDHDHCC